MQADWEHPDPQMTPHLKASMVAHCGWWGGVTLVGLASHESVFYLGQRIGFMSQKINS